MRRLFGRATSPADVKLQPAFDVTPLRPGHAFVTDAAGLLRPPFEQTRNGGVPDDLLGCDGPGRYRPPRAKSTSLITPLGHRRTTEELQYLWKVKRPEVTRKVSEAAALSDRSESAVHLRQKQLREIDCGFSSCRSASVNW